jgi:hypothetical protein
LTGTLTLYGLKKTQKPIFRDCPKNLHLLNIPVRLFKNGFISTKQESKKLSFFRPIMNGVKQRHESLVILSNKEPNNRFVPLSVCRLISSS